MRASRPAVGGPAPALELVDADGCAWRLREQRGTVVVLLFHRHIH